jgi:hypothetical protein
MGIPEREVLVENKSPDVRPNNIRAYFMKQEFPMFRGGGSDLFVGEKYGRGIGKERENKFVV